MHLIRLTFGQKFKFHSNLSHDTKLLINFPAFYKNTFRYWSQHFTVSPQLPSSILSTFLWYNEDILISNEPIYFKHFSNNNLNYVTQLFDGTGNTKEWMELKQEFKLNNHVFLNGCNLLTQYLKNGKIPLKSDSYVQQNFCQIKVSLNLVQKNTIICLFRV